jgi:hypothetical protein
MQSDVSIIAKTLYGEARSEGYEGILAVATVIFNRAKGDKNEFAKVCLKPKQFSCWNDVDDIVIKEKKPWKICESVAQSMWDSKFHPYEFKIKPTNYLTYALYSSEKCPNWARGVSGVIVGKHIFLQLKN